jgi:hypothetical protein
MENITDKLLYVLKSNGYNYDTLKTMGLDKSRYCFNGDAVIKLYGCREVHVVLFVRSVSLKQSGYIDIVCRDDHEWCYYVKIFGLDYGGKLTSEFIDILNDILSGKHVEYVLCKKDYFDVDKLHMEYNDRMKKRNDELVEKVVKLINVLLIDYGFVRVSENPFTVYECDNPHEFENLYDSTVNDIIGELKIKLDYCKVDDYLMFEFKKRQC